VIEGLDHVAYAVSDLEAQVELLTRQLGLELVRRGTFRPTGAPLALLREPRSGLKLELVEGEPAFLHLAFAVDDVAAERARLGREGLDGSAGVVRIEAAQAESALLTQADGPALQLLRYDAGSPDA